MPTDVRGLCQEVADLHEDITDLGPFYDRARVCIAPLRFGAGVKGKVTQAFARGVPCVATKVAAEGSHAVHRDHILIADDADAFADAVNELFDDDDLWRRLAVASTALAEEHFSISAARRQLKPLLDVPAAPVDPTLLPPGRPASG